MSLVAFPGPRAPLSGKDAIRGFRKGRPTFDQQQGCDEGQLKSHGSNYLQRAVQRATHLPRTPSLVPEAPVSPEDAQSAKMTWTAFQGLMEDTWMNTPLGGTFVSLRRRSDPTMSSVPPQHNATWVSRGDTGEGPTPAALQLARCFSKLYVSGARFAATLVARDDIDDTVQEALTALWLRHGAANVLPDEGALCAALLRIIKDRAARGRLRHTVRQRLAAFITPGPWIARWASPARPQEVAELVHNVRSVLDRMRPTWRESWLMHYEQGMAVGEIAEGLGRAPATIRSNLTRANELLRRSLTDAGFAPERPARRAQ